MKRLTFKSACFFLIISVVCVSCASSPMIQPQINGLVVGGQYNYALSILCNNEKSYGPQNKLLYLLDYGFLLQISGEYKKSIQVLEDAKRLHDQLFTVSLSNQASTWLMNDNTAPYRGEDFERVMLNIVQALNFAAQGDFTEALVEARDVDSQLNLINRQYRPDQQNAYKEDAFARLLMGLLYEASGSRQDLEDALVSYKKAIEIYEIDFLPHYDVPVPKILKENILSLTDYLKRSEYEEYRQKYPRVAYEAFSDKQRLAQLYVVNYSGYSPIKYEVALPIPLPGGIVAKLAFPAYRSRMDAFEKGSLRVEHAGIAQQKEAEVVSNIDGLAMMSLSNRKARVMAKALARSAGKYLAEKASADIIGKHQGDASAALFKYLSSLYNIASERADLRSWQTLPATICLVKYTLKPGAYQLWFNQKSLEDVTLKPGEVKFLITRTAQLR